MDLIKELNKEALQKETANVQVGDTVRVHVKVKEGSRERIQVFEGTVIAKKHGGIEETVTVRRVSYGIGVEKVFPVHYHSTHHFDLCIPHSFNSIFQEYHPHSTSIDNQYIVSHPFVTLSL